MRLEPLIKLSGDELRYLFPGRFRAVVSGLVSFQITARRPLSIGHLTSRQEQSRALERVCRQILNMPRGRHTIEVSSNLGTLVDGHGH
jgi:hypothetical protein